MRRESINKAVAPKEWLKFKRWFKAACTSSQMTAEEAYKSLGYTLPKPKKDVSEHP